MFCSGVVPYSTLTWQYAAFVPLAATTTLFTDFMTGFSSRPLAGSVASNTQLTGAGGGFLSRSRAAHGADASAARASRAVVKENNGRYARFIRRPP